MNWNIAFESIAILNISTPRVYNLEILFKGTNPITKGMKFYLIIALFEDLVKKLIKLTTFVFFTTEGILKISGGHY